MKKITAILLLLFLAVITRADDKLKIRKGDTLYFWVDTVNTPAISRLVEIGFEGQVKYYTIASKCIPGYTRQPVFVFLRNSTILRPEDVSFKTVNLKEMLELLYTEGKQLGANHPLFILEVLPDKRILKSSVSFRTPYDGVVN